MVNKRKMPKFLRWTSQSRDAIKSSWRRPRGINSKVRKQLAGKIKMPSISYGAKKDMRYIHPSGKREVLVHTLKDLEKLNSEQAVRIASAVGRKKRLEIMKKSEEMKLKVLNPMRKSM